jgi:holin-like protein
MDAAILPLDMPGEGVMRKQTRIVVQAGLLTGIWWICDWLARTLALPVPGSILALALVLGLLLSGVLRAGRVRHGAGGLLDHMVLFFVPAVMALMNHPEWMGLLGLKILLVITGSTVVVMAGTALVVDLCFRWRAGDVS